MRRPIWTRAITTSVAAVAVTVSGLAAAALPPPSHVGPSQVIAPGEPLPESGPKDINWSDFGNKDQPPYFASVINFAVLAFLYVYFGKAPIAAALKARREEVQKQIEEAQKIKHEAEARSKQYAAKLGELDQELEKTRATLVATGAAEKARIVKEAEEKAARMQKDAEFLLEQERKQLRVDLQREAVQTALAAAEELLRAKLTPADHERVAEEFLASLTASRSARAGGAS